MNVFTIRVRSPHKIHNESKNPLAEADYAERHCKFGNRNPKASNYSGPQRTRLNMSQPSEKSIETRKPAEPSSVTVIEEITGSQTFIGCTGNSPVSTGSGR